MVQTIVLPSFLSIRDQTLVSKPGLQDKCEWHLDERTTVTWHKPKREGTLKGKGMCKLQNTSKSWFSFTLPEQPRKPTMETHFVPCKETQFHVDAPPHLRESSHGLAYNSETTTSSDASLAWNNHDHRQSFHIADLTLPQDTISFNGGSSHI